jgi:hypothetical protein
MFLLWGSIRNASPLTGDLSFLLLNCKISSTDGPVDEMIQCQLYKVRNTELFNQINILHIIFM